MNEIQKQNTRELVEALRSNEYTKCNYALAAGESCFCVTGLMAHLYFKKQGRGGLMLFNGDLCYSIDRSPIAQVTEDGMLVNGTYDQLRTTILPDFYGFAESLEYWYGYNDSGMSFAKLADLVERRYLN